MFVTLDTETISTDEKLIYDIGFAVHDAEGNIFHKQHFLVSEIFDNLELMKTAFYFEKNYQTYLKMLSEGSIEKHPFGYCLKYLCNLIDEYNIDIICAYNILFDTLALYETFRYAIYGIMKKKDENGNVIKSSSKKKYSETYFSHCSKYLCKEAFNKQMQFVCIMGMTCEHIMTQPEFLQKAVDNKWFTEKGNIQTSAECAYRFITENNTFDESHTALDDVLIEIEIFRECMSICEEVPTKVKHSPYHIVKRAYKELFPTE